MAMEAGELGEGAAGPTEQQVLNEQADKAGTRRGGDGSAPPININLAAKKPTGTIFAVFVVAGLIAGLTLIEQGAIAEGTFLALLLFLLLGAIVPPVALTIGVIIVFYLLFTGAGNALSNWVKGIVGSKGAAPSPTQSYTGPYAVLGPSVPGATQTPANGAFGPLGKSVP